MSTRGCGIHTHDEVDLTGAGGPFRVGRCGEMYRRIGGFSLGADEDG